jgi:hypothetical protein
MLPGIQRQNVKQTGILQLNTFEVKPMLESLGQNEIRHFKQADRKNIYITLYGLLKLQITFWATTS